MDGFYSTQLSRLFSANRHQPPEYLTPVHSAVHLLSLCVLKLQSIIWVRYVYSSIILGNQLPICISSICSKSTHIIIHPLKYLSGCSFYSVHYGLNRMYYILFYLISYCYLVEPNYILRQLF